MFNVNHDSPNSTNTENATSDFIYYLNINKRHLCFSCTMLYKLALKKNRLYWFFTPQDSKKNPACPFETLICLDIDYISYR